MLTAPRIWRLLDFFFSVDVEMRRLIMTVGGIILRRPGWQSILLVY
jgi:hypothetical protein